MTRRCPSCYTKFREDKAVCPSCKKTHPAVIEERKKTVSRREGTARTSDWDSAPAKYLRYVKLVDYLVARVAFTFGGVTAGILAFGLGSILVLSTVSDPENYAVLANAVEYITETATILESVGGFASLTLVTIIFVLATLLFVSLGFSIKHGYQVGWLGNILVYVGGPLLVGGLTGRILVVTAIVLVLPTTWWPIIGRGAVRFDPRISEEIGDLRPALRDEFKRLLRLF